MTRITISGNLTADPELRITQTGRSVVGFTVAENDRRLNKETNQYENVTSVFWRCSAWGNLAENIFASVKKGNRVVVFGRTEEVSFTNRDGIDVRSINLVVEDIGQSLLFAKTTHNTVATTTTVKKEDSNVNNDVWDSSSETVSESELPF